MFLLKFGEFEHMQNFYKKGELCINTFQLFKTAEEKPDGRADKHEYASQHFSGEKSKYLTVQFIPHDKSDKPYTFKGSKDFLGLTLDYGNDKNYTHLFCMSMINPIEAKETNKLINPKNFAPKKDYVVFVHNGKEFISRLDAKLNNMGIFSDYGLVNYVDKKTYTGEMGPFRKFSEYSYQNELRFTFLFEDLERKFIYLDSLEDIAYPPMNETEFYNIAVEWNIPKM